ncbi:MAG: pseudouridine synthase [Lachnospiraceae bacterium]|nr:pseudouridine synthase [Lachnospiraceae bacterium]
MQEQTRLNKYLAQCGVCSRREADRLIEQGRVLVNGIPGTTGQQVSTADRIHVNGKLLQGVESKKVLAFYKPVGVTCTEKDRHAEKIITDMIDYPVRVTYAGRLDKDSEGLILLTNDGDLIDAMMRGANRHEKEYQVRVNKEITEDFLSKMREGIFLKDLEVTTRPCEVEQTGKLTFKIILTQGLNRQIRRMCQACGYQVKTLKRVRVMNILLGSLKPGEYREIGGEELKQLYSDCRLRLDRI